MTNNQNHPRKFDAVRGGETPPPAGGAVLGGIEGVKQRLASSAVEARVAALSEALNYGDTGLDLVIKALEDKSRKVQKTATSLLRIREENQAKIALHNFKFWTDFERLNRLANGYAKKFVNRKVIEFDGKTSVTDTVNAAYALRTVSKWSSTYTMREAQMNNTQKKLKKLLQDSRATEVEALVFGLWTDDSTSAPIVNALVEASSKLTSLKAVFIGDIEDSEDMISSIVQSNLSPILEAYPNLEVLQVRGSNPLWLGYAALQFSPALRHENLKTLIVESGGLSRLSINQICELELPALEYLELWLGSDNYGGDSSINDLMPIISGVFPKLKYLGLRNSEYSDDIAFAIVNSPIIENLVELDFSMGTLGDDGAEALLNCPAINYLDTLNVSDNCLTDWMMERLNELDIEVIIGEQNPDERYCSVAE